MMIKNKKKGNIIFAFKMKCSERKEEIRKFEGKWKILRFRTDVSKEKIFAELSNFLVGSLF
jgi:hypothetical protein